MRNYFLASIALLLATTFSFSQNSRQRDIDAFISQTGAIATTDKATSSLNFLRFPIGQALSLEGSSPEQKALSFLTKYPGLFERKTKDSYQIKESKRDNYGLDHVTMQQYYDRVPIYDGVLKFHFNKEGELTSVNGNFIIAEKLNVTSSISSAEAGQQAIKFVTGQKLGKFSAPLKINKNTLLVFQKGLAQGYRGPLHLVYEVEVRNDADVREFLYIDAHTKELVEQFTGMHSIDRKLYETSVSAPNLKWQEADGIASPKFTALDQWQKSEIESAGHIYNLMKNSFGWNSYDGAGATMITINNDPNAWCPNASWNGVTAGFCTETASDDVVAHEWAHAYTEYTSGLIYAWQAGALNEAYSDIWGETVDQLNGYFDSGESNSLRNGCAGSAKWRIGEQASGLNGPIRDMWDPTCKNNPGKISDPQYWCAYSDNGGVHINSGVLNHAFALLVDGGSYNGQTITGLGLTKTAHLFWYAQAAFMTKTTDYSAQADILESSLINLIGVNLPNLSINALPGGPSGSKFTATDIEQLARVIAAVEMRMENGCGFAKLFTPVEPLCKGAESSNAFFFENFENGIELWTAENFGSSQTWTPRNWNIDISPPEGRIGQVAFASDFNGGDCGEHLENGVMSFTSPVISIPADAVGPFMLAFDHYISLEQGWDGGHVSCSIGGGIWKLIPKVAFTKNGYNSTVAGDNPLAGNEAFSGGDEGSFNSGWGNSRIDLSSLGLMAGNKIRLRWDLSSDGCLGWDGWYIDDIRVYTCALPTVQFVTETSLINESQATISNLSPNQCLLYSEKLITVKINKAPSQPVTVTFLPPTGTATQGPTADFTLSPSSFILQAGTLSKDVLVKIYNDAYMEPQENIKLKYILSSPAGGNAISELYNQEHIISIMDDDIEPSPSNTTDLLSESFNDGFPIGWNVLEGGSYPATWGVVNFNDFYLDSNGKPMLFINSDVIGPDHPIDKIIETPVFNSLGQKSLKLSFWEYYVPSGNVLEKAIVDFWDGEAWQNLLLQDATDQTSGSWEDPVIRDILIPSEYQSMNSKIRFRYIANYDWWWAIDNVKVTGTYNNNIQTTLSQTPDSQYLGPNSTVYFRDPTSGDLIAKIKNLTAHDYGCTSVQVDRAGTDETAWVGTKKITKKTFKVTPTNVNPNGNYEITLYYKASELANFNGSAIKSMGKSDGGIQQATVANSQTASVQMAMFNNDYAYTATFNSGFSGFGLSDAAAGSALPVTLVKFEGKNTSEGNVLVWETSTELNNDYFIVERSVDAEKFVEISRMEGVGNSAIRNTYSFTDNSFINYLNYYRLKQVDKDGTFAYSRMIAVESPGKDGLKYFPNPVQSLLNIKIPENGAKSGNVSVINAAGQVVLSKENVKIQKGELSIDLSKLVTGIYQIVISTENGSYHSSVVKAP
ncbi:M4 family metallopeptidase [Dyadobacter sp. CY323]|uniref:M4 family metallopeptidase n=1 Tax=Dyadobacter sp. CY323 TaxID=2907302 RepID=UPI001F3BC09D|nr:M4 family metallopeptidase [Dyadobacter sp. CY323]MCE6988253.1 M4 family metallopeptidase [Dyadobacter sp. CY323]